jgi:hypothetical protein
MKIDAVFPRRVGGVLLAAAVAGAYPLARFGTGEIVLGAAAGALLSTLNVLVGFLTIEYAFERSYSTFLKAILGGMGLRMLGMLGALTFLISVVRLHTTALIISMFGFYLVYLILEILHLQRRVAVKNQR